MIPLKEDWNPGLQIPATNYMTLLLLRNMYTCYVVILYTLEVIDLIVSKHIFKFTDKTVICIHTPFSISLVKLRFSCLFALQS